jgi:hypothetical protein
MVTAVDEICLSKIQDVLNNIISKRILDKGESIAGNLSNETRTLLSGGMVNAALKDTASMAMSSDDNTVGTNSIVDELGVLGRETVETLLNHMIAVQILDEVHHPVLKITNHGLRLLRGGDKFNHFLQSSSSMLVKRNLHKLRGGVVDKSCALLIIGVLKQLLAEIITERI